jgi:hypothetical protein
MLAVANLTGERRPSHTNPSTDPAPLSLRFRDPCGLASRRSVQRGTAWAMSEEKVDRFLGGAEAFNRGDSEAAVDGFDTDAVKWRTESTRHGSQTSSGE